MGKTARQSPTTPQNPSDRQMAATNVVRANARSASGTPDALQSLSGRRSSACASDDENKRSGRETAGSPARDRQCSGYSSSRSPRPPSVSSKRCSSQHRSGGGSISGRTDRAKEDQWQPSRDQARRKSSSSSSIYSNWGSEATSLCDPDEYRNAGFRGDIAKYVRFETSLDYYSVLKQLFSTLATLHAIGVFHGDVQSTNILIDPADKGATLISTCRSLRLPIPKRADGKYLEEEPYLQDVRQLGMLCLSEAQHSFHPCTKKMTTSVMLRLFRKMKASVPGHAISARKASEYLNLAIQKAYQDLMKAL